MKVISGLVIGFIGVLLELFLAPRIQVKGFTPYLATAFILFAAMYGGRRIGLWAGLVVGLILDFYARYLIGFGMILFSISGYVAGYLAMSMYLERYSMKILLLFLVNMIYALLNWLTNRGGGTPILLPFWKNIVPGVIYSTTLGTLIIFVLFYLFENNPFLSSLIKKVE